jgi:hypothetical protein
MEFNVLFKLMFTFIKSLIIFYHETFFLNSLRMFKKIRMS